MNFTIDHIVLSYYGTVLNVRCTNLLLHDVEIRQGWKARRTEYFVLRKEAAFSDSINLLQYNKT